LLQLKKTNFLYDAGAICRYIASKQKKLNLVPEDDLKIEEFFELITLQHKKIPENKLEILEKELNGSHFVGSKLTLADIIVWVHLFEYKNELSKYTKLSQWFKKMEEEKHDNLSLWGRLGEALFGKGRPQPGQNQGHETEQAEPRPIIPYKYRVVLKNNTEFDLRATLSSLPAFAKWEIVEESQSRATLGISAWPLAGSRLSDGKAAEAEVARLKTTCDQVILVITKTTDSDKTKSPSPKHSDYHYSVINGKPYNLFLQGYSKIQPTTTHNAAAISEFTEKLALLAK